MMQIRNKESDLVSIVVPCYAQAEYLPDALDSVLAQTNTNWECIIVNDGSPDNTEEIADEYCMKDKRFSYLKKENGGLSSARNAGIRNTKGSFIVNLDADDIIDKSYVQLCLAEFAKGCAVQIVYSEAQKFGAVNEKWELAEYSYDRILVTNMIFCSAMFKKEDWEKYGGFDESLKRGSEDWEFWVRILNEGSKVFRIPQILFYYRIKPTSMFKEMTEQYFDAVYWTAFKKNFEKYKSKFPAPQHLIMKNERLEKKCKNLEHQLASSISFKVENFCKRFINRIIKSNK